MHLIRLSVGHFSLVPIHAASAMVREGLGLLGVAILRLWLIDFLLAAGMSRNVPLGMVDGHPVPQHPHWHWHGVWRWRVPHECAGRHLPECSHLGVDVHWGRRSSHPKVGRCTAMGSVVHV